MRDPNKICPCGRGLKRKKCLPEELLTAEDGSIVHAPPPVPREPMTPTERREAQRKLQEVLEMAAIVAGGFHHRF